MNISARVGLKLNSELKQRSQDDTLRKYNVHCHS